MADKKTGKSAASHKKAVKEFKKEGNPDFQKSGGSDFQPRDSDVFQEKTGASQKPGASKSHAKKEYGETFGQNVQKSGADKGQEEKAAFTKAENTFSGQDNSGQTEENGKRQEEKEDYHRRDTYRQSQEKGKYHKKRVQREHKHREKAKDTVFTEDAGKVFTEDRASEFTGSEKLKKKQKQAQKAAEQVKKARGKLPKKREYTLQRVFDEETGKGKYVVVPLDKEKPFKQGSLSKTTMRRMQTESRNFVHGKIAENEKENSAVEGAHKTEQKGEELIGFVKRHYKGKEARQKGAATKAAQEAVSKTANTATAIAKKLQEIASKNAGVLITVGIMAVLLIMIMTSVSSCGAMFADTQSTVLAASYLSEPAEIDATDLQFTRLELDLQNEIDNIETDYPGYDEYSYNLGEIGHNPFTLIGYLSAVHTEFTASEVESEVQALFGEMYTLTLTPDTETRTRTVTKTGTRTVTDPVTGEETEEEYEYEEEEEYEVSILRVVLTVKPLETIVAGKMDAEQTEIYAMYAETGGFLQQFASPLDLYWYNYISSYYGYRKNPNTGNEELHRGVDIAVPTGTTVYAAHDGTVTTAAYDSYYGNYVVIEKDGYTTKYAHMDSLSVSAGQSITKGTVIGTTGNTGSSTGSHLHIECLYNGEYYNPLFYFDVGKGTLYGESPGGGGGAPGNAIPPDSYDDATVQALMEEAAKYLGYPYVWGGSSPSTSFDCSGFVCWVFTNSGVHNLPRTTAQGIYDQCTPVSASEAKAGDIIFFTGTYNSAGAVSHVGIYCGNGVMIHCGDPIKYASINTPYWQSHFYSFGRLN